MKKYLSLLLAAVLCLQLLLCAVPQARAFETTPKLTGMIKNPARRHFAESMLSYHLQENTVVRNTLRDGYSALFLFEGCSDKLDDPQLQDLSYYRVGAVCIALKLDEEGIPQIIFFHDGCSTLPDRPLDIGAWELEEVGAVGPATVCDGTYELYSVYHMGSYEALHIRTSKTDETAAAIYMTPEGFVPSQATYINIHTRTGNHALQEAMWSAGCMLVGDGDFGDFQQLIAKTYYSNYNTFRVGNRVGTVTINRLFMQEELLKLYEDPLAVETLLVSSRCEAPQIYLDRCDASQSLTEETAVRALRETQIMSLPCSGSTDSRSILMTKLEKGDKVDICGSIVNTEGNTWYEVEFFDENGYVYAGDVEEVPDTWVERLREFFGL